MRDINSQEVTGTVARLCQEANYFLPPEVLEVLRRAEAKEESPAGKDVLQQILENARIAQQEEVPMCQDTGTTVVFLEVGQEAHISGGDLYEAVQEGVRQGYIQGYLRKSIVDPPIFERSNTRDNTPAVIHTDIVPGDKLKITVLPKGGGSENMSALAMLTPAQGVPGIMDFVVKTVEEAGSNPCPPVIVGVGIGGTAEKATLLAKKAILREIGKPHPDPRIADLERQILEKINATGVGPMGFGGRITALAVHLETFPTHITSLPVAVNLLCHAARQKTAVL